MVLRFLIAVVLSIWGLGTAFSADFQVDSGDTCNLGGGTLNLECGNLTLQSGATLNAGSGDILLSGNWDNQGTFNRGSSSVVFNDSCGAATTSSVTGETYFHNLTANTAAAHELQLASGQTQSMANALVLTGAQNQLLKIRSSAPGAPAYFMLAQGGSQTIDYVDVQDNHAPYSGQWLAPNAPEYFNSVNSGGNFRWFRIGLAHQSIPTLPGLGLVLLAMLMLVPAYRHKRGL